MRFCQFCLEPHLVSFLGSESNPGAVKIGRNGDKDMKWVLSQTD